MVLNNGAFTGLDSRSAGLSSNLAVQTEIYDLTKAISIVSSNAELSVGIDFSVFTNKNVNPFMQVAMANLTIGSNTFIGFNLPNHQFRSGDELSIISSGLLPTPLTTDAFYYALIVDQNNFIVAKTKADANNGLGINITNPGSGNIQVKLYLESEKYQRSLLNQTNYVESSVYNLRIQRVISHFQNLGYTINPISNPDNNGQTFYWQINW